MRAKLLMSARNSSTNSECLTLVDELPCFDDFCFRICGEKEQKEIINQKEQGETKYK